MASLLNIPPWHLLGKLVSYLECLWISGCLASNSVRWQSSLLQMPLSLIANADFFRAINAYMPWILSHKLLVTFAMIFIDWYLCHRMNIREAGFETFSAFFEETWNAKVIKPDQPLMQVQRINKVMNYMMAVESVAPREKQHNATFVIPEFCVFVPQQCRHISISHISSISDVTSRFLSPCSRSISALRLACKGWSILEASWLHPPACLWIMSVLRH